MRSEETERLLGGYATGSLTESERRVLFEAALEDQQVFDALQDEEALRDLLADGESRTAVERALRLPVPEKLGARWFARPWVWGWAVGLAASCVLAIVLLRPEKREIASVSIPPMAPNASLQSAPEESIASKQRPRAKKQKANVPQPGVVAADRAPEPTEQIVASPAAPMAMSLRSSTTLPLAFVVVAPSDVIQAGDAIRIRVRPDAAGVMSLLQRGAAGTWTLLEPAVDVLAGQEYTIPRLPFIVTSESNFRLMLVPTGGLPRFAVFTVTPGKAAPSQ